MTKGKTHSMRGRLLAVLFWLLLWQVGAAALNSRILLVSPLQTLIRLAELICSLSFWQTVMNTSGQVMAGFGLALGLALPLSFLAGRFGLVSALLSPALKALRSIPVASFIILALILLPSRMLAVLISFMVAFPILYQAVADALQRRSTALQEAAAVFRLNGWRRLRYLDAFQLLPALATACRMCVGMCWKAGVAAELIGIPRQSIGERLQQAKLYLDTADLFAWTAAIIVLSAVFERAVLWMIDTAAKRALRF